MFFFVLGVLLTLSLFLFQLLPFVLQLILTSLETVSHENVLQVVFFVQEPLCCHLFGHVFSFFKFSLCFFVSSSDHSCLLPVSTSFLSISYSFTWEIAA